MESKPAQVQTSFSCPRCGGTDISFQREQTGAFNTYAGTIKAKGNNRSTGYGTGSSINFNQTVAVCQKCGHTWVPDHLKPKVTAANFELKILAKITLFVVIAIIALFVFLEIVTHEPKNTTDNPALNYVNFELEGDVIHVTGYRGKSPIFTVQPEYVIDGKTYITDISSLVMGYQGNSVSHLIISEGITSIGNAVLSGSEIDSVDLPKSLKEIPSNLFYYVDYDKKVKVHYAGSLDEWNAVYQPDEYGWSERFILYTTDENGYSELQTP